MVRSKVSRKSLTKKKNTASSYSVIAYIGAVLLLIASVIALCVVLLYKPFFQISHIDVMGTKALHKYDVAVDVQSFVSEKWAWVVPRDSWVTLPNKKIETHLYNTFDRIRDVHITVQSFDRLVVEIDEWDPAFLWCNVAAEADTAKTERNCWFMDAMGNVFSEAPYFSPGVYPMFVTEKNSLDTVLGSQKIDPATLDNVLVIYTMLENHNHSVETIRFGDQQDIIFTLAELDNVPVDSAELYVTQNMSIQKLQQNIDLLLNHTSFQEKFSQHAEDLLYVDVRFDGKLLFKFDLEETNS